MGAGQLRRSVGQLRRKNYRQFPPHGTTPPFFSRRFLSTGQLRRRGYRQRYVWRSGVGDVYLLFDSIEFFQIYEKKNLVRSS